MAGADPHLLQQQKRRALREFDHKMKMLLTDADREYVYNVLKEFKMIRDVDKLVACMKSVLDTPVKMDILKDVRNFVPSAQIGYYDRLAPYNKMSSPWTSTHMTPKGNNRKHIMLLTPHQTPKSTPKMAPKLQAYSGGFQDSSIDDSFEMVDGTPLRNLVHSITIVKDRQEHLGFSIRGGSEHGLGIYVSEIEAGSAADNAGLEIGDNIVEVNTIKFDSIASSSAVKVLTGSNRLKMAVRRMGKIPGFRSAKAKISWYDVTEKKIIDGDTIDHQQVHDNPAGLGYVDGVDRRINLAVSSRDGQVLGFNIRGGSEFGLGIYVSRVDKDGLAEQQGLKMGDQITHCNGRSFERLSHVQAVDVMKSQKQLVLTVRDAGRFPAYKEIYAEYQWINAYVGTITRTRPTGQIDSIPVRAPSPAGTRRGMFTEYPTESRVEAFAQTDDEADDSIMIETVGDIGSSFEMGVQTEARRRFYESEPEIEYLENEHEPASPKVLVPYVSDIIMSQRPPDASPGASKKEKKKDRTPKSTLAVRAMEIETRKKHPELAMQLEQLAQEQNAENTSRPRSELVTESNKKKSKSASLRGLLFGSKSKGSKDKGTSQVRFNVENKELPQDSYGKSSTKTRSRAPLTSLNFESNTLSASNDDSSSAFASGLGSQLSLRDSVNSSVHITIEDKARRLVSGDEVSAIMRHIRRYEYEKNIHTLAPPLAAILDSPEKSELLYDIRSVILPADLDVYDALTGQPAEETHIELTSYKPINGDVTRAHAPVALAPGAPASDSSSNTSKSNSSAAGGVERIKKDVSSKEAKYARVKRNSAPIEESNGLEIGHHHVVRKGDAKPEFTMKRASGQSKVYKALVDIDFGEGGGAGDTVSVSSSQSGHGDGGNELVVVAHVEPQSAGYSDNLYVETRRRGSRTSEAGSLSFPSFPSPSPVSAAPRQTHPESEYDASEPGGSGMNGYIDLANSKPAYAAVPPPPPSPDDLASATADFGFLDNMDASTPTHSSQGRATPSQRTATPSPPYTPKSTRSDISDLSTSTREGFYAVNSLNTSKGSDSSGLREGSYEVTADPDPELDSATVQHHGEPSSGEFDYASDSLRRRALGLPPLFLAPPPPDEPPPPSESDLAEALGELDDWVADNSSPVRVAPPDVHNSSGSSVGSGVVRYTSTERAAPQYGDYTVDELTLTNEAVSESRAVSADRVDAFFTSSTAHLPEYDPDSYSKPGYLVRETQPGRGHGSVIRVYLNKHHKSLGISISGGSDSKNQPEIKINGIFPGGAATEEGTLKPGMRVLSIDGREVADATHQEAVTIIRQSYSNKTNPSMEWVVAPLEQSSAF